MTALNSMFYDAVTHEGLSPEVFRAMSEKAAQGKWHCVTLSDVPLAVRKQIVTAVLSKRHSGPVSHADVLRAGEFVPRFKPGSRLSFRDFRQELAAERNARKAERKKARKRVKVAIPAKWKISKEGKYRTTLHSGHFGNVWARFSLNHDFTINRETLDYGVVGKHGEFTDYGFPDNEMQAIDEICWMLEQELGMA